MTFPPKCGSWLHVPIDIPNDDPDWKALTAIGVRSGRLCKKHGFLWRHLQPPAGWSYSVNEGGVAVLRDRQWRKRVLIVPSDLQQKTMACLFVLRYYNIRTGGYAYEGSGFVLLELYDHAENVVYTAFARAPLGAAFRIKPYIHQMYSLVKPYYPHLTDPTAYWDTYP